MMTLRRFAALTDSYGADLVRWPDAERGAATALLAASADARARLGSARILDDVIAEEDAALWGPGEPAAALARLRAGVEARIALPAVRQPRWSAGWSLAPRVPLRWIGLVTGGGLAVVAGVLIGAMYTAAAPEPEGLMAMLQSAPIHVLAD